MPATAATAPHIPAPVAASRSRMLKSKSRRFPAGAARDQQPAGDRPASAVVREAGSRIGLDSQRTEAVCTRMEEEVISSEWQLQLLAPAEWQTLGAPLGLRAACRAARGATGDSSGQRPVEELRSGAGSTPPQRDGRPPPKNADSVLCRTTTLLDWIMPLDHQLVFKRGSIHSKSGAELKAYVTSFLEMWLVVLSLLLGVAVALWSMAPDLTEWEAEAEPPSPAHNSSFVMARALRGSLPTQADGGQDSELQAASTETAAYIMTAYLFLNFLTAVMMSGAIVTMGAMIIVVGTVDESKFRVWMLVVASHVQKTEYMLLASLYLFLVDVCYLAQLQASALSAAGGRVRVLPLPPALSPFSSATRACLFVVPAAVLCLSLLCPGDVSRRSSLVCYVCSIAAPRNAVRVSGLGDVPARYPRSRQRCWCFVLRVFADVARLQRQRTRESHTPPRIHGRQSAPVRRARGLASGRNIGAARGAARHAGGRSCADTRAGDGDAAHGLKPSGPLVGSASDGPGDGCARRRAAALGQ